VKLYVDYSTLSLWRLCPQKFIFNSKLNLGKSSTEPLDFGKLIHLGTELYGIATQEKDFEMPSREATYQEIEALCDKQLPDTRTTNNKLLKALHTLTEEASKCGLYNLLSDERRSLKHLLTLTTEYAFNYYPDTLKFKAFEQKFEIFLGKTKNGHEVYYRGTIDGLLTDGILERKTTYDLNSFLQLCSPNYQAVGYTWAGRELTGDKTLSKVIFDGISTKGYGKSTGSYSSNPSKWTIYNEPQKLFLRAETRVSDDQIEAWKAQTLSDADRFIEDYTAASVTRNAPAACHSFNTVCPYKAICMSGSKTMEAQLINSFEKQLEPWEGFEIKP